MRVTAVIENTSRCGLPVEHGLSLYVELDDGRRLLFDMGQGSLFAANAAALGLSVADVDVAIVSHGHYDHGGGLRTFLEHNSRARVYVHHEAFRPHYSLRDTGLRFIGIDPDMSSSDRIVSCGSLCQIDEALTLFADVQGDCCAPVGNRLLYGADQLTHDDFRHEQNLLVQAGSQTILFAGCAHRGIVNILRRATALLGHAPTHVFAGMHLVKSGLTETEEDAFIATLAHHLLAFPATQFYTMHCTGAEQYLKLKAHMADRIDYLACGDSVTIPAC